MPKNSENRGGSHRLQRIEKEIREVIGSYLIFGFKGDLPGIVSITRVIVSGDVRTARVLVTMMSAPGADPHSAATKADRKEMLGVLKEYAGDIQAEVNRKLQMKFTPKLSFQYDDGFENALRVEGILREIGLKREQDEKLAAQAAQLAGGEDTAHGEEMKKDSRAGVVSASNQRADDNGES